MVCILQQYVFAAKGQRKLFSHRITALVDTYFSSNTPGIGDMSAKIAPQLTYPLPLGFLLPTLGVFTPEVGPSCT